jgi:hypothetical protein
LDKDTVGLIAGITVKDEHTQPRRRYDSGTQICDTLFGAQWKEQLEKTGRLDIADEQVRAILRNTELSTHRHVVGNSVAVTYRFHIEMDKKNMSTRQYIGHRRDAHARRKTDLEVRYNAGEGYGTAADNYDTAWKLARKERGPWEYLVTNVDHAEPDGSLRFSGR